MVERMIWLVLVSGVLHLHYLAQEDMMFVCHMRIAHRRTTKDPVARLPALHLAHSIHKVERLATIVFGPHLYCALVAS